MAHEPLTRDAAVDWLDDRAQNFDDDQLSDLISAIAPVLSTVPELAADADLLTEGDAATRELLRLLIAGALPADAEPGGATPPGVLVSVVRTWARRGIDMRALMKGFRGSQAAFWRYWMTDVAARIEDPDLRMRVLEESWVRVSAWHEAQIDQLETIYAEERERWLRGGSARRSELVRSLLAGKTSGSEEAALALGHDLRRNQSALVLWSEGEASQAEVLGMLEESARELAGLLGAPRALCIPAGARALWAWIATDDEPGREAWDAAARYLLPAGVRVAAGRSAPGAPGFRTSHHDAQLVRHVMAIGDLEDRLVRYGDVELVCIMSSEPGAMRRLVAHALGALAERDATAARLRETARVYLECGSNAREAAERLNMHKNTVHYRLARIEEQLGRPITERRLELEVALMLAHMLGNRVLR